MGLQHIAVIGGRRTVYLDAREEHLTPDDARNVAAQLVALADRAEELDEEAKG